MLCERLNTIRSFIGHRNSHISIVGLLSSDTKGCEYTLCVEKMFPPCNCLQLCQILTDVQIFCTAGKRMKFATKPIQHYPTHLKNVATLPWKNKNSNFMQIFSRYVRKCKQIAFWVHRSSSDCQMKQPRTSFWIKEYKVSGRLREVLKQKLSVLRASSTVRVGQLLCMAPLETFQTQVLTNNPGQKRPINTCLPWYVMDSPVGLRPIVPRWRFLATFLRPVFQRAACSTFQTCILNSH